MSSLINLRVTLPDCRVIRLALSPGEKIGTLRHLLLGETAIRPNEQILIHRGQIIDRFLDSSTLKNVGIENGDVIQLQRREVERRMIQPPLLLRDAVKFESVPLARLLIEEGSADVNLKDPNQRNYPPLFISLEYSELVNALLGTGADTEDVDSWGRSVCSIYHPIGIPQESFRALAAAGAPPCLSDPISSQYRMPFTVLYPSQYEQMQTMLEYGAEDPLDKEIDFAMRQVF